MVYSDYTSADQIRAVLGVTKRELTDETLALEVYSFGLSEDLLEVSSVAEATYTTVNALATKTATEARVWRTARTYATYAISKRVGVSLSMFGPKDITDGKAGVSRFSTDPYRAVMKNIDSELSTAKQRLLDAIAAYSSGSSTQTVRSYFNVSSLSSDPVTGS